MTKQQMSWLAASVVVNCVAVLATGCVNSVPPLSPGAIPSGLSPNRVTMYTVDSPGPGRPGSAFLRREDHPRWDMPQTEDAMNAILADGYNHEISILFADQLKVRVRSNGKRHLVQEGVASETTTAVAKILTSAPIERISRNYSDESLEDQFDKDESSIEEKYGYDFPNRASFARIKLADSNYSPRLLKELVRRLQAVPGVKCAELVPSIKLAGEVYRQPPNDTYFPSGTNWQSLDFVNTSQADIAGAPIQEWWLNRHSFGAAWDFGRGSGIKVAVIDDGFEPTSNDGVTVDTANQQGFWEDSFGFPAQNNDIDWRSGTFDPNDTTHSHGTETFQLVGGKAGNSFGLCGGAPDATILPLKITGQDSWYSGTPISRAIDWAVSRGAQVISISLDYNGSTLEANGDFRASAINAYSHGVSVVIAAGNETANISYDPATFTHAIVVGGINNQSSPYFYQAGDGSNFGTRVDIAAAAQDLSMASHNNGAFCIRTKSGTSYATPLVASAAALLRQFLNDPDQIREVIIGTADIGYARNSAGWDQRMDSGQDGSDGLAKLRILNAAGAVAVARRTSPWTVYMGASDNFAEIYNDTLGVLAANGGHPINLVADFPVGTNIRTYTNNYGGPWAQSVTTFKNHRVMGIHTRGICYGSLATGDSDQYHTTFSNDPQTTGWVDILSWTLN